MKHLFHATALCAASIVAIPSHAVPLQQAAAPAEAAWKVLCPPAEAAPAPSGAQPCSLVQNLVAGEQKQRLLTVIFQRTAQAGHSLTIALPHGLFFPAGVTLQVDDGAEQALVVQTSDENGAYVGIPVDAAMRAALTGGKSLKVGFTGSNGQRMIVPVTLKDFPAGLAALDKSPLPGAPAPAAKPKK